MCARVHFTELEPREPEKEPELEEKPKEKEAEATIPSTEKAKATRDHKGE